MPTPPLPGSCAGLLRIRTLVAALCTLTLLAACIPRSETGHSTTRTSSTSATTSSLSEQSAKDMLERGRALIGQRKPKEAIAVFDELFARYGNETRSEVRSVVVSALFEKASILGKQGDINGAILIYDDIEFRYGAENTLWAAWALNFHGELLSRQRNAKAAIAIFDQIDQRFSRERDPDVRVVVASALINKGALLGAQGDIRAAAAVYDQVDRRFGMDSNDDNRLKAVQALYKKGILFLGSRKENDTSTQTSNPATAIAVFDDIAGRFSRDTDARVRVAVGVALLKKSEVVRQKNGIQNAIAVYDDIVARLEREKISTARILVATALYRKGLALRSGNTDEANAAFEDVIQRFGNDSDPDVKKIVDQARTTKRSTAESESSPSYDN